MRETILNNRPPMNTNSPNVKQAVPFFMVDDMQKSLQFYRDGLGFAVKTT